MKLTDKSIVFNQMEAKYSHMGALTMYINMRPWAIAPGWKRKSQTSGYARPWKNKFSLVFKQKMIGRSGSEKQMVSQRKQNCNLFHKDSMRATRAPSLPCTMCPRNHVVKRRQILHRKQNRQSRFIAKYVAQARMTCQMTG
eukprot:6946314-Karenia_brevis.AAC.1